MQRQVDYVFLPRSFKKLSAALHFSGTLIWVRLDCAAGGSASGNFAFCDVTDIAYSVMIYRGATADQVYLPVWPPFIDALAWTLFQFHIFSHNFCSIPHFQHIFQRW